MSRITALLPAPGSPPGSTPASTPQPAVPVIAPRVVSWQRSHGRHALPWQQTRDPYRVWLSEIMLQQTQVATVLGYYARFLERFPEVAALAAAPLDDVLALWSGLGYYSRARNLHRCARAVMAEHGGVFPGSAEALATLPGIGRSTSSAIAAFCYGERAAILDGNVKRVLTRVLGFADDLAQAGPERRLWALAGELLPPAGDEMIAYTQGVMDLGATVCHARAPRCEACPLADLCAARAQGRPEAYPVKSRKLKRGRREHALLWLQQGEAVWLVQRPETGVWAGLWSLPEFESVEALQAALAGWPGGAAQVLPTLSHALSHFDWALTPVRHRLPPGAQHDAGLQAAWPTGRWVGLAALADHGLPAPIRKLLATTGTASQALLFS